MTEKKPFFHSYDDVVSLPGSMLTPNQVHQFVPSDTLVTVPISFVKGSYLTAALSDSQSFPVPASSFTVKQLLFAFNWSGFSSRCVSNVVGYASRHIRNEYLVLLHDYGYDAGLVHALSLDPDEEMSLYEELKKADS